MAPLIVKLIGAAIGSLIADTVQKKVSEKNQAKALPTSKEGGNSVDSNASSVPKGKTDDSKKPNSASGNRGNQRPDSGVSDKPNDEPGVTDNEPDK